MKTRESGMPEEAMWDSFFDPESILAALALDSRCVNVVEFGCGYGTFTIPAANVVSGTVFALDIEPEMIQATEQRAVRFGVTNVRVLRRDFVEEGTGLPDGCVDYAMLFNILHCEEPSRLLREAHRVLAAKGKLGIIHWRSDIPTPRGPSLDIRPTPDDCANWAAQAGFDRLEGETILIPPYHFGIVLEKGRRIEECA
ncbi:MAG: class I SAM-dependent methyltransferase [Candidatus Hydrogenedentes bacterium]|nr:class I SAM-dependent methyltransferase [Candidatus Hydrogenedentota bacterium]